MATIYRFWPAARRRRKRRIGLGLQLAAAIAVGLGLGSVVDLPVMTEPSVAEVPEAPPQSAAPSASADFSICHTGGGRNCVVDGDTFWLDGEKIRIADIDAPETHPARCAEEDELGKRATTRLAELLNAGAFSVEAADRPFDRYGRRLAVVTRDGQSLGELMVGEGLARQWDGARRPWC